MFIPFSFFYTYPVQASPVITGSALYNFTTFTFTNASATGRQGPTYTQLTSSYAPTASWVTSSQFFTASITGIQEWTVPESATYRITAAGAAGGSSPTLNFTGGFGASVTVDIALSQSQKILLVVGQRGGNRFTGSGAGTFNGASGGGGTFVYDSASVTYYLAVGGGGGAGGAAANLFTNQATASGKFNTTSGSTVIIGTRTLTPLVYFTASGGTGGAGGFRSDRGILYGGTGAGILSSGSAANGGQGLSRAGNWLGGTTGSTSNINGVEGGFGGGGGAVDGDAGGDPNVIAWAGGGGGYSGGGSGGNSGASNSQFAGGGGSYYTGSFVTGSSNINQGHGYITITKL